MDELMKNQNSWIWGIIVIASLISGIVYYKRKKGKISKVKKDDSTLNFDNYIVERLDVLTYEWILKWVESIVTKKIDKKKANLCFVVIPNSKAIEYYTQHENELDLALSSEDVSKMVIILIKCDDEILAREIVITQQVGDDYNDIIPADRIYMKKIRISDDN